MELLNDNTVPLLSGTILILVLIAFIILFVIQYKKAQLKFELEKKELQEAMLKAEIEIQEQTLDNVSRELHDNIGQIASLLKINLNQLLSSQLANQGEKIQQSVDLTGQLITDIKATTSSLKNNQLNKIGLKAAIQEDSKRINKLGLLEVLFETNLDLAPSTIDKTATVFIYRMYQEALNNVLSHSQATKVHVVLESNEETIQLKIKDDGIGFDPAQSSEKSTGAGGNGLFNLQERAKMIDAKLTINSKVSEGTEILITLPLKQRT